MTKTVRQIKAHITKALDMATRARILEIEEAEPLVSAAKKEIEQALKKAQESKSTVKESAPEVAEALALIRAVEQRITDTRALQAKQRETTSPGDDEDSSDIIEEEELVFATEDHQPALQYSTTPNDEQVVSAIASTPTLLDASEANPESSTNHDDLDDESYELLEAVNDDDSEDETWEYLEAGINASTTDPHSTTEIAGQNSGLWASLVGSIWGAGGGSS